MEVIPFLSKCKRYTYLDEYNNGTVDAQDIQMAQLFYDMIGEKLKTITNENELFLLYLETVNTYLYKKSQDTQDRNNVLLKSMNQFDKILVALASEKGLKLIKVYRDIHISNSNPKKYIAMKSIIWRGILT